MAGSGSREANLFSHTRFARGQRPRLGPLVAPCAISRKRNNLAPCFNSTSCRRGKSENSRHSGFNFVALTRFSTNTRLWLVVSLILFLPPWFIGHLDRDGEITAAGLWVLLFSDPLNLSAVVGGILACMFCFGIPALAIGWVLHRLIVMVMEFISGRKRGGF